MKIAKLLFLTITLIFISFRRGFSQAFLQEHKVYVKTNILLSKRFQHWMLGFETKTKKINQSNSLTAGFDYLNKGEINFKRRKYITYRRVFYSPPIYNQAYIFISPYTKIVNRKVYQEGVIGGIVLFPISHRNYESNSLALGCDVGMQAMVLKRISIGFVLGLGVGKVLSSKIYSGEAPTPYHLDGQGALQLGYVF